ncbi:hypothetical protein D3C80_1908950 [compost metagenome]
MKLFIPVQKSKFRVIHDFAFFVFGGNSFMKFYYCAFSTLRCFLKLYCTERQISGEGEKE